MKLFRLIASISFITAAIAAGFAQNGTMTPYSRYAYGMLGDHASGAQRSMGGVGYAMNSGRQINAMNPASYAAIDSLTFLFDIGIDLTSLHQSELQTDGRVSHNKFGGGLDYVTLQVPLGRYMGASLGLLPYSSVGYAFGSKIDNGIDSRQGSGSLNEFYLGIAGRPFKGFTVGANISYLFGTILNDTYGYLTTGGSSLFQNQMSVRDYHLEFGIQYGVRIGRADRLSLGLVYSPSKTLLGTAQTVVVVNDGSSQETEVKDHHSLRGNYSLPEKWGAGISYTFAGRLTAEFDYTYQPWSKARYRGYENTPTTFRFTDRSKYALGLELQPDQRGSYFKRVRYRLGGYYTRDYLEVLGKNGNANGLREFGVTAGFGFPVPSFRTIVNLGFEFKHRAANPDPLIKENYFNITIGVNFNEMWFRQSKIY